MPRVLLNPRVSTTFGLADMKSIAKNQPYKYEYPDGLDLRPGSEKHQKIRDEIIRRANGSQEVLQKRFSGWKEIDRTLTAYIPLDTEEKKIQDGDDRKPIRVVIPTSYATLDTLLTYQVAAFLEEPIFRYEGVGPEDVLGAIAMELIVAQQCRRAKVGLEMHTMWRDAYTYGIGPIHIGYENKSVVRTVSESENVFSRLMNKMIPGGMDEQKERVDIYAGGVLTALDPYMCLIDPNTPIHDVQNAEFFGWVEDANIMSIMSSERDSDSLFNAKYVKHIDAQSMFNTRMQTGRQDKRGETDRRNDVASPVDVIHMYMRIIPADMGLGEEEYPEWWKFELAGDEIVLRAQPVGLDHGQLPVTIAAPDYDGHSMTPISRLEVVYGLQQTVDWFVNSHVANVRKSINDMFVVDPMLVNIHDVVNPGPGKVIRMRRQAWGRGVKDAVMQLGVTDVTRGHIADSGYIMDMVKYVTGAQDAVSGVRRNTSERVSATEASDVRTSALSRLEKAAKIMSMQAHYDIAHQMAWNTRQLMEEETYAKILGENLQVLEEEFGERVERGQRLAISPKELDINFDVIPHDGSIPSNGNPNLWVSLFQIVAGNEELSQSLDVTKIFKYGAKLAGAKNINEFVRRGGNMQPQVMPDEEVLAQSQQGNMAPIDEFM